MKASFFIVVTLTLCPSVFGAIKTEADRVAMRDGAQLTTVAVCGDRGACLHEDLERLLSQRLWFTVSVVLGVQQSA